MLGVEVIGRIALRIGLAVVAGVAISAVVERVRRRRSDPDADAIGNLHDPDPKIRAAAAARLAHATRSSARPALESALRDPESSVRIAVVTALCELGDRAALPALHAAAVDEPDAGVRAVIASAIERLGD